MTAPKFIREDKENILTSMELLNTCFGTLPGNIKFDKNSVYILYGNKNKWNENVKFLQKVISINECKDFSLKIGDKWIDGSLYEAYECYTNKYGYTTQMIFILILL